MDLHGEPFCQDGVQVLRMRTQKLASPRELCRQFDEHVVLVTISGPTTDTATQALAQYAHPLRPIPALCHRLIINIHGAHRSRRPETEPIHLDQRDGGPRGSSKAE